MGLASGRSATPAASEAGVSRRTLDDWRPDPEFLASVERYRDVLIDQALGRLAALGVKAAQVLDGHQDGKEAPDAVKARVALGALDALVKSREPTRLGAAVEELKWPIARGP
jgi:hypothetical protein